MHWLEDEEDERVAAVSCQTISIVQSLKPSLKPEPDKRWWIIYLYEKIPGASRNENSGQATA